ncbi:S-layer homology domain-containing protein [Cohnella sp. LGH]|uniref:S-layer homology domain-containing protein n=1 Tax=Cohnella sp. LGH TaxID=1619153 RepID=UPI001ADD29C4|nr:S-layer homology domain-containing protein [Cohnella sp. LGH]QTH40678.1 S-layer homology domain-containing protein [Cohnella sp. LGH]
MSTSKKKETGKRFGHRSRKAIFLVFAFLLALPALTGGNIAQAASDTSSWTLVDDGGLIKDRTKDTNKTDLIEYNGELYVLWSENAGVSNTLMHAMKYDGTDWIAVDERPSGCMPTGCLNANAGENFGNKAGSPSLAVFKDKMYASWYEGDMGSNYQTRVRQFDGTNWTTVDGGTLNLTDVTSWDPKLTVFNDELYAIWQEHDQIQVKKYDDTGAEWQVVSPTPSLSGSGAGSPQLAVYDGSLYAVWREESGIQGVQKIKVSRYVGGTDWESIDGGGFGSDEGTYINHPNVAVFGDKMYVAWSDNGKAIRVKSYDEENGWQWADDNAGLNYTAGSNVSVPKLIAYDGQLYAAWVESNTVRAKKYDGISWTTADSDHGLNARIGSTVNHPSLAVYGGKLFAAWTEKYDGKNQVRVARMPVLQAPDAPGYVTAFAGDGEATVFFYPPASNGGSPITEYTVTSEPAGGTQTGSASPIKVTGLTNGQSYTFTVTAKNALGTSEASAPSSSVTPKVGFKIFVSGGMDEPADVAVDDDGNIYVADSGEGQVLKYDTNGLLLAEWKQADPNSEVDFGAPAGVAVSVTGSVYVADSTNARVYSFNDSGSLLGMLGENGELTGPSGVALDKVSGKVYVADSDLSQIKVYDANGSLEETWGDVPGNGAGQFSDPSGIAVDSAGNVYVADTGNHQIQKWDSNGQFVKKWGSMGLMDGQFFRPGGVAVDGDGNVFVADTFNSRVQKFDSEGNFQMLWGRSGDDEGQFDYPRGIAVDNYGNVYVADTDNSRIQILRKGPILPSIAAQPSDTTAVNGSASFSVSATGTGLTYQWQVYSALLDSFMNVPGATNSTLTLVQLSASNSGARYRVVVSGSGELVTSSEATLTVDGAAANPSSNSVTANTLTVKAGATITLSATGDRQAADGTVNGDERYVPTTWTSTEDSKSGAFEWNDDVNGYVSSYLTAGTGSFVVTATFQKQRWNGSEWVDIVGSTSTSTVNVTVNSASPGGGSISPGTAPSTGPVAETGDSNADILVNGKAESAGKATTTTINNRKVTTIAIDADKLDKRLAAVGDRAIVTIPVGGDSDVVIGELNGQMIKNMEDRQAILEIRTDRATYTVPALQIDIEAISKQIGASVALKDIKVRVEIAASAASTVQLAEGAGTKGDFTLVAPPVDFKITISYGDKTIEIAKFNAYVERTIAIPEGGDPNRITTGVVIEPNGTVRHVPTKIIVENGKYYARINSLTNSSYSVVWHPLAYHDMEGHWAQEIVNDMGSRMVIEGTGSGTFSPDRDITRAEFAAIVVRGLGLNLDKVTTPFADVAASDWYAGAVKAAHEYGLIDGFEDGRFRPNDKITREQALLIIAKAMAITGLKEKLPAKSVDTLLKDYADNSSVSGWARSGVADSVQAGIVTGRNGTTLAPKAYMTRAEVAAIVSRLLKESGLI